MLYCKLVKLINIKRNDMKKIYLILAILYEDFSDGKISPAQASRPPNNKTTKQMHTGKGQW